jgi:hypothetical protein
MNISMEDKKHFLKTNVTFPSEAAVLPFASTFLFVDSPLSSSRGRTTRQSLKTEAKQKGFSLLSGL